MTAADAVRLFHDRLGRFRRRPGPPRPRTSTPCAPPWTASPSASSWWRPRPGYARISGEHFLLGKTATVRALLACRAHRDHDLAERPHSTTIEHYEADNRPERVTHELALLGAVAAERGEPVVARVR